MATLEEEIAKSEAKVARLKAKKREREAKERDRFSKALMSVIEGIENLEEVTVRVAVDRARAVIDEQDAKRKRAAQKSALSRRQGAHSDDVCGGSSDAFVGNEDHQEWGGFGA